jgi:hypothetical protein
VGSPYRTSRRGQNDRPFRPGRRSAPPCTREPTTLPAGVHSFWCSSAAAARDAGTRRLLRVEAVAQTPGELAGSVLRVGSETRQVVRHAPPAGHDVAPLNRSGTDFREHAAPFPKRLYATASMRRSTDLIGDSDADWKHLQRTSTGRARSATSDDCSARPSRSLRAVGRRARRSSQAVTHRLSSDVIALRRRRQRQVSIARARVRVFLAHFVNGCWPRRRLLLDEALTSRTA